MYMNVLKLSVMMGIPQNYNSDKDRDKVKYVKKKKGVCVTNCAII